MNQGVRFFYGTPCIQLYSPKGSRTKKITVKRKQTSANKDKHTGAKKYLSALLIHSGEQVYTYIIAKSSLYLFLNFIVRFCNMLLAYGSKLLISFRLKLSAHVKTECCKNLQKFAKVAKTCNTSPKIPRVIKSPGHYANYFSFRLRDVMCYVT